MDFDAAKAAVTDAYDRHVEARSERDRARRALALSQIREDCDGIERASRRLTAAESAFDTTWIAWGWAMDGLTAAARPHRYAHIAS